MKRISDRKTRHARVRAKIIGTTEVPRLSIFRSNRYIVAQLIDDQKRQTLGFADDLKRQGMKQKKVKPLAPMLRAQKIGQEIATIALSKKIKTVIFDRGGYRYHGVVKAVAEGAREAGLKF